MPVTIDKKAKTALVTIRPHEIINEKLCGAITLKEFLIKRANKEFEETHEELYDRWFLWPESTPVLSAKVYYGDFYWRVVFTWREEE